MLSRILKRFSAAPMWLCAVLGTGEIMASDVDLTQHPGFTLFKKHCAYCHGENGEGVEGEYDEPLFGDDSVLQLSRVIEETMPDEAPEEVVGEDAAQVADYIYQAFYSQEARARMASVTTDLAHLTVRQYEESVADLIGSFRGASSALPRTGGLEAEIYAERRSRRDKKIFERVTPRIDLSYGSGGPLPEELGNDEFFIRWRGAVIAPATGDYAFSVHSENGFQLWVNDMETPLIDAFVASGGEVREHEETVRLLGGRAYPVRLDFFKYKDKSASISLRWKPPGGLAEVIPPEALSPERRPTVMVVSTKFPADDSSQGYARGTTVSKGWERATTYAAIEVANHVVDDLEDLADCREDAPDRPERLRRFVHQFAERAFRRSLIEEEKVFFVDDRFAEEEDLGRAIKQAVLLILKSPRFLYPELAEPASGQARAAARLALGLWDSLPDESIRQAVQKGELSSPEAVEEQARAMVDDPRTRAKIHGFFEHWLEIEGAPDLSKDPELFPGFDETTMADMRRSLEMFIDDVVWSERSDYRELFLADHLYLNGRLAAFLGVDGPESEQFEKVTFDHELRSGLVTHPYLLSRFAYYRSTSPIHRGVFLTRRVLGRALKPPPEAIEFEDSRFDPHLSMREKVTDLTKATSCMSCHSTINPLGFSLEHFDAVGRFRLMEKGRPIDAGSDFTTVDGRVTRLGDARDVAEQAVTSEHAQRAFVERLFQHVVKQPVQAYGSDALAKLSRGFRRSNYSIRELLVQIATVSALHDLELTPHDHDPKA